MKSKFLIALVAALLTLTTTAFAQTQTIPVLGVGELVIQVPASPLVASAQDYAVYVDGTRYQFDVTCAAEVGATGNSLCPVQLSQLKLQLGVAHKIEVASILQAADGTKEGTRVAAPFALLLLEAPVNPTGGGFLVRPQPQAPPQ